MDVLDLRFEIWDLRGSEFGYLSVVGVLLLGWLAKILNAVFSFESGI
jgi:hypothetical protein